jgi:broad specificity phosphatase PhoE
MAVIVVRHAMPEVVMGVSSTLWRLSEAAKEDCVLLAHALPQGLAGTVYSSGQPKADETAGVIALRRGLQVAVDVRLREVEQAPYWEDDYRGKAAGYLAGRDGFDWEPRASATKRFAEAVGTVTEANAGGDVVVVSHGLAMSQWIDRSIGGRLQEFDAVRFWRQLTFPDAWRVDTQHGTLERVFWGGVTGE